jgi:hypothetical protein
MADPHRLLVLKALTAQLNTITVANGYRFDIGANVFRGRSVFGENDPEVMLSLLESPRPDNAIYASDDTIRVEKWSLLLQGWCPEDPANPSDNAYLLQDDAESCLGQIVAVTPNTGKALFPQAYLLGGLITSFTFGPGVVRPPLDGVSSRAFFYLPLRVGLAQRLG